MLSHMWAAPFNYQADPLDGDFDNQTFNTRNFNDQTFDAGYYGDQTEYNYNDSEPQHSSYQVDDIWTQYHPHSKKESTVVPFEAYKGHGVNIIDVPEDPRPWYLFSSRIDFELFELILDTCMNHGHIDRLFKILDRLLDGEENLAIRSWKKWDEV